MIIFKYTFNVYMAKIKTQLKYKSIKQRIFDAISGMILAFIVIAMSIFGLNSVLEVIKNIKNISTRDLPFDERKTPYTRSGSDPKETNYIRTSMHAFPYSWGKEDNFFLTHWFSNLMITAWAIPRLLLQKFLYFVNQIIFGGKNPLKTAVAVVGKDTKAAPSPAPPPKPAAPPPKPAAPPASTQRGGMNVPVSKAKVAVGIASFASRALDSIKDLSKLLLLAPFVLSIILFFHPLISCVSTPLGSVYGEQDMMIGILMLIFGTIFGIIPTLIGINLPLQGLYLLVYLFLLPTINGNAYKSFKRYLQTYQYLWFIIWAAISVGILSSEFVPLGKPFNMIPGVVGGGFFILLLLKYYGIQKMLED
jgi:hypothetical protein